ncbi:hypothetical protein [Paenibacillus sp. R14(2021)]|uniref:hypothetical protein n=1 Tax=Paenibacillus sp. R14(2021) TaxID=2859228 RepID=UPI001C616A8C|nr:hypothetical protein [Paenibacillus sp. R14(2021)]
MDKNERVIVLLNMYKLVNLYYEERDLPNDIDIFKELDQYCSLLEVDFTEFRKQFGIKKFDDSF